jgi:methylmalonyl-CoA mutase C-terminal domain/subunit
LFPRVVELLVEREATDVVVFGGGIIPAADIEALKKVGLAEIFTPGTPLADVVIWVNDHISER